MIEIKNVDYSYRNKKRVLQNVNLEIEENEMIAIIGKNGSRKIYFS